MRHTSMTAPNRKRTLGAALYFSVAFLLGLYFTFAAVQGENGLFRRIQIEAQVSDLKTRLATLQGRVGQLTNKTHRLSDSYLDLDLLDEQARKILGYLRPDEIIVR